LDHKKADERRRITAADINQTNLRAVSFAEFIAGRPKNGAHKYILKLRFFV
jgi:hypothetical protein